MNTRNWALGALSALVLGLSSLAMADASIVNDFESEGPGAVAGGADARTPGGGQWWNPDNAATQGAFVDGIGLGGSRGLEISNDGSGNDGVIHGVQTARLLEKAGESSVAPNSVFKSSYWFRTADTSADDYFNKGNSDWFIFGSESWGTDRTTYVDFYTTRGDGVLKAYVAGIDGAGNWTGGDFYSGLLWGEWYKVEQVTQFVDGPAGNDWVTTNIYDASNVLIATATVETWEEGQRQFGYNGGNLVGVDALSFQARYSHGGTIAYVDNLSYEAVPEPMTMLVLAGLAALKRRKKAASA